MYEVTVRYDTKTVRMTRGSEQSMVECLCTLIDVGIRDIGNDYEIEVYKVLPDDETWSLIARAEV